MAPKGRQYRVIVAGFDKWEHAVAFAQNAKNGAPDHITVDAEEIKNPSAHRLARPRSSRPARSNFVRRHRCDIVTSMESDRG